MGTSLALAEAWLGVMSDPWRAAEVSRAEEELQSSLDRLRVVVRRWLGKPPDIKGLSLLDLNELVSAAMGALEVRGRPITIEPSCEPSLWPVIGEKRALEHVLVTLLLEATEIATPGDWIVISTTNVGPMENRQPQVRLIVRVCCPERGAADQGEPARLRIPPLCRALIEDYAGTLEVTADPGSRSVACVTLPTAVRRWCGQ